MSQLLLVSQVSVCKFSLVTIIIIESNSTTYPIQTYTCIGRDNRTTVTVVQLALSSGQVYILCALLISHKLNITNSCVAYLCTLPLIGNNQLHNTYRKIYFMLQVLRKEVQMAYQIQLQQSKQIYKVADQQSMASLFDHSQQGVRFTPCFQLHGKHCCK